MKKPVKPCALPCPKCGGVDVHRHYRQKGEQWDVGSKEDVPFSKFINIIGDWTRQATQECITHHCRTCHYDWQTPVAKVK